MPIPKIGACGVAGRSDSRFVMDVTQFRLISRNREQENVLYAAVVESGGIAASKIARRNLQRALQNAARNPVEESAVLDRSAE